MSDLRDGMGPHAMCDDTIAALRSRVEVLEQALREWIAARNAEESAARSAARVRAQTFAGQPPPPRRMPRSALLVADLPPDEQRRINDECAKEMAPIHEAEGIHSAAKGRLADAISAAREVLRKATPPTAPWPAPSLVHLDDGQGFRLDVRPSGMAKGGVNLEYQIKTRPPDPPPMRLGAPLKPPPRKP